VPVGEDERGGAVGRVGAQVDAGALEESGADAEAARRVVVAGDHDGGDAEGGEPVEGVVEEAHGAEWGHGPVVDVAGDEYGVDVVLARGGDEVVEEGLLGVEEADAVETAAEVPVGGVQEPHGSAPAGVLAMVPALSRLCGRR
jgi:hypothetical protein